MLLDSNEEQTMDANAERLTEIVGQFLREAMRRADEEHPQWMGIGLHTL